MKPCVVIRIDFVFVTITVINVCDHIAMLVFAYNKLEKCPERTYFVYFSIFAYKQIEAISI